jgi:hypothetical protein
MRGRLLGAAVVAGAVALGTAGCGASRDGGGPTAGEAAETRVERCTSRFLERLQAGHGARVDPDDLRRYVATTYCAPFEARGWVYDDGSLGIDAHRWATETGVECGEAGAGEPTRTVPCEVPEKEGGVFVLDCALLHYVRKSEVETYVEELRSQGDVECDDGTDVADLGAGATG